MSDGARVTDIMTGRAWALYPLHIPLQQALAWYAQNHKLHLEDLEYKVTGGGTLIRRRQDEVGRSATDGQQASHDGDCGGSAGGAGAAV